jgi:hypothetical protein
MSNYALYYRSAARFGMDDMFEGQPRGDANFKPKMANDAASELGLDRLQALFPTFTQFFNVSGSGGGGLGSTLQLGSFINSFTSLKNGVSDTNWRDIVDNMLGGGEHTNAMCKLQVTGRTLIDSNTGATQMNGGVLGSLDGAIQQLTGGVDLTKLLTSGGGGVAAPNGGVNWMGVVNGVVNGVQSNKQGG